MKRSDRASKLNKSIRDLESGVKRRKDALNDFILYAGIAKCYEVCLEYAWKFLKLRLEDEGLEAYSPKEIVKAAGKAGLVDNVESWIEFINARNFAVHDYLGVTPGEYLNLIESFIVEVKKIKDS